jgi:hypothetical protein
MDLFMTNTILERKVKQLPLEARQEVSDYLDFILYKYRDIKPIKPYAGCMKGTVLWMSDDFNEPLDDFKDYM